MGIIMVMRSMHAKKEKIPKIDAGYWKRSFAVRFSHHLGCKSARIAPPAMSRDIET
jgi:hypothetical protein